MVMEPSMTMAAALQRGKSAVKSGTKLALDLANKTESYLEKRYSDLPELCRPQGADFSNMNTLPLRIKQNIELCDEIADGLGRPEIKASLAEIIEHISSPLYKVFVIGRYSTGKSSVLNALLGRKILPSGTIPTTKVLTWILAGEDDSVICEKQNGEIETLSLSSLSDMSSDNAVNQSRNIMVTTNNDLLNSGVALIDTPGLQDTDQAAIDTTNEAIESADALLYVVDTYMSAREEEFLAGLVRKGKTENLFVIINKMDCVPDDERQEFIEERIDVLNKLGIAAKIYPISAKDERMKPQLLGLPPPARYSERQIVLLLQTLVQPMNKFLKTKI